jgi:hypothetical protein
MKTKHTSLLMTLLAALLMGAVGGCQTNKDTGAFPPLNTDVSNLETIAKFVLLDPGAQRSVTCTGLQTRTLSDGRLKVVANLRNRENRRIEVQVNCVFKDAQGFPVDRHPFQTLILTENAMEGVSFTSLNNQAIDFTVRVRQAR